MYIPTSYSVFCRVLRCGKVDIAAAVMAWVIEILDPLLTP